MMYISEKGIALIKRWEGLKLEAYDDGGGVFTIGYGHTDGVSPGDKITQDEAEALLRNDLGWAVDAVNRMVGVKLEQHQFDALVSWVFNVGSSAARKSTLVRKLKQTSLPGFEGIAKK